MQIEKKIFASFNHIHISPYPPSVKSSQQQYVSFLWVMDTGILWHWYIASWSCGSCALQGGFSFCLRERSVRWDFLHGIHAHWPKQSRVLVALLYHPHVPSEQRVTAHQYSHFPAVIAFVLQLNNSYPDGNGSFQDDYTPIQDMRGH